MSAIPTQLGYAALFGLVGSESAGVPLPGETALIAAGVLAGSGQLTLSLVIATATAAAALGDTVGYWVGRRGGRAALQHDGPLREARNHALDRGERFFARHGAKTVFFGRFVPGVRVVAAVLAGASRMSWPQFALANVTGALVWSATVAGLASLLGAAVASAVVIAAIAAGLVAAAAALHPHLPRSL